jgi:hypothetical protein
VPKKELEFKEIGCVNVSALMCTTFMVSYTDSSSVAILTRFFFAILATAAPIMVV